MSRAKAKTVRMRKLVNGLLPTLGYHVACALDGEVTRFGASLKVAVHLGDQKVGGGNRSVGHDRAMSHIGFGLDDDHQGNGFAQAWIPHCFEQYRRFGFERVKLTSGATHVWGRLGFEWSDPSSPDLLASLDAAITKVANAHGTSLELYTLQHALTEGAAPAAAEIAASPVGVDVLRHVNAPMTHHLW